MYKKQALPIINIPQCFTGCRLHTAWRNYTHYDQKTIEAQLLGRTSVAKNVEKKRLKITLEVTW